MMTSLMIILMTLMTNLQKLKSNLSRNILKGFLLVKRSELNTGFSSNQNIYMKLKRNFLDGFGFEFGIQIKLILGFFYGFF